MFSIWLTYLLAAAAASGIFILAGRRSRQVYDAAGSNPSGGIPHDPLWAEGYLELPESNADAGATLRTALRRLAPVIRGQSVQAEIAAPLGLLVRMRASALADLLEDMLASALHAAPASRILLTAAAQGDRVAISVTDDMPGGDLHLRSAAVRPLMERVAMRGGSLEIDVRPAEGTTITLRFAAVMPERRDWAPPEPADRSAEHPGGDGLPMVASSGSIAG